MSTELRVHSAKTFGMSSQQLLKTMPKDYIGTMEWVQKAHGDFVCPLSSPSIASGTVGKSEFDVKSRGPWIKRFPFWKENVIRWHVLLPRSFPLVQWKH